MARKQTTRLEQRRREVAKLLKSRVPQIDIARQLGISPATVSRDVSVLRAQWREEMSADMDSVLAQELAEIADMERAAAVEFVNAPSGERSTRWLEVRLKCKQMRAKLLGLDSAHEAAQVARAAAAAVQAVQSVQRQIEDMTPEELADAYRDTVH